MAEHTKETRVRPKRPMHVEKVNTAIADIREIIGTGRFNRGEAAGILAALLAHVCGHGVEPDRREVLLEQVVDLVRQLFAEADAREEPTKVEEPVM